MRLRALVSGLCSGAADVPDLEVAGVAADSRRVRPGDLFVAVPGTRADGAAFARDAVARGAAAVVAERPLDLPVPCLVAADAARALGELVHRARGEPSRDVRVTGVTGTNGKTTTTYLLAHLLGRAGRPASLLGTVATRVAGVERVAAQTTPDVLSIHDALAATRDAGWGDLVMEVSSHALDQRRVAGVRFRCAVFTNLTRDHLDYHRTLEAYGAAKARLFEDLAPDATCVLNARDPFSAALARGTRARVLRYGWVDAREGGPGAGAAASEPRPERAGDVTARVLGLGLDGARLVLRLGGLEAPLVLPLVGTHNVENALAAAAAALALGVPPAAIAEGLASATGVPGRLERVPAPGAGPCVLVDYAHTPDALERVLGALRPLTPGRLVVVFGCGGDRDRGKRAPMGRAVERQADLAFVTSDNPRSEEPRAILAEVVAGFERPAAARVLADRAAAIEAAIAAARPGDVVLLAGKGHETTQVLADRTVPFSDREVAARFLAARAAA